MGNLKIWKNVEKTDPKFIKEVNFGRKYKSIDPQYQLKLATEQFGSYGKGFGLSETNYNLNLVETHNLLILSAVFFYVIDGERYEFPITTSQAVSSGKGKVDTDVFKKLETDLTTKALSKLGFNADVFLGMFDGVAGQEYAEKVKRKISKNERLKCINAISEFLADNPKSEKIKEWMKENSGAEDLNKMSNEFLMYFCEKYDLI